MEYQMEELLPLAASLADKYTMGESSSVSYETAQMLMEAILYCIREFEMPDGERELSGQAVDAGTAWRIGYKRVVEKVFRAKAVYDDLLNRFKDYGCRNYSDTIRAGMPSFFLYYDARFKPQDHILTLDYPLVRDCGGICGADRIYRYLQNAAMESDFLSQFCESSVWGLLKREEERYQTPYMGNLCQLVLLNAMGRTASGRPGADLILDPVDYEAAREYFSEYSLEEIEEEGAVIVRQTAKAAGNDGMMDYFRPLCHDCAFQIQNGLENGSLFHVFVL